MKMNNSMQQVIVNVNDLQTVLCSCGQSVFSSVQIYKVVPSIYSNTGKATLVALPCMKCTDCGAVRIIEEVISSLAKDEVSPIIQ